MNGKYEARLMVFSLKDMCALKVAQQVATAVGLDDSGCCNLHIRTAEIKASSTIQALEIPRETMETVEGFISLTMKELHSWLSRTKPLKVMEDPVFRSYGIIDKVKSVNAILSNEKTDYRSRYMLACENCCEEVIAEMHQAEYPESPGNMWISRASQLPSFWRKAFSGFFGELVDGRHLPQNAYDVGFRLALEGGNDVAVKFFIDKASLEEVRYCICEEKFISSDDRYEALPKIRLSPPIYCLLFSKLSEDQQLAKRTLFSHLLLKSLLDWPYQHFFLSAMNEVASHLNEYAYWNIMGTIIKKIENQSSDFNYYRLFARFWCIGSGLRINMPLCCHLFSESVFRVLMIEDDALMNFVLSEITTDEKDRLLMEFKKNMICIRLIEEKLFRPLQLFIRCCCMHRKDVLIKFKSDFLQAMPVSFPHGMCTSRFFSHKQRQEWETGLSKFIKIIDDIVDQKRNSDAMEEN